MPENIIRKVRFFGAWQDEKEEAWLEEMAGRGYHLEQVGFPLVYGFVEGQPRQMAYRLDYTSLKKKDRADYYQLFQDAGWERVGEIGGWQYFRKAVEEGERAEIYTDNRSKVAKYQRVLLLLIVLMPVYTAVFSTVEFEGFFMQILQGIMFVIMMLYIYTVFHLIRRIGELKEDSE